MMKKMRRKGQAEIMDGLILMLIAAICSTVLLNISSNYGIIPTEVYEETYAQKLAQNTLLSLYHITYLNDEDSPFYKKSIMVAVSQELSAGNKDFGKGNVAGNIIRDILNKYSDELGWDFMFTILSGSTIIDESMISTDPERVNNAETFKQNVGNPFCASAALTYPQGVSADCSTGGGGSAGDMCYAIFEICAWQP